MKRKIVVASIVLVVLILIFISSWLIYKKYIKKPIQDELPPDSSSNSNSNGTSSSPAVGITPSFPLRKGMSGPMISDVQNAVNKKCNANLVPDGKLGQ